MHFCENLRCRQLEALFQPVTADTLFSGPVGVAADIYLCDFAFDVRMTFKDIHQMLETITDVNRQTEQIRKQIYVIHF